MQNLNKTFARSSVVIGPYRCFSLLRMGVVITVVLLLRQSIEIAFLTIDFRVRPLLSLRAGS